LGGGEQPSEDRVATVRLCVGRLKIPSCLRDHYPTENSIRYPLKTLIIGRLNFFLRWFLFRDYLETFVVSFSTDPAYYTGRVDECYTTFHCRFLEIVH